jgi:hypothetical protein
LIKKKELEVPENLEKKIREKYTVNIDRNSQKKVKSLFEEV